MTPGIKYWRRVVAFDRLSYNLPAGEILDWMVGQVRKTLEQVDARVWQVEHSVLGFTNVGYNYERRWIPVKDEDLEHLPVKVLIRILAGETKLVFTPTAIDEVQYYLAPKNWFPATETEFVKVA